MTNNPWEKADELRAEAHRRYEALSAGAHGGVSQPRREQLLREWQEAHRAWWDEVQRVGGTP
ncbi:hypothetical protein WMF27_18245 [Sorangium sp. So ce281]|uniref:hypothetical protein n=1 Tax=unclassified Sorangium TaxID=2621164 RepID=UPI003F62373F